MRWLTLRCASSAGEDVPDAMPLPADAPPGAVLAPALCGPCITEQLQSARDEHQARH